MYTYKTIHVTVKVKYQVLIMN